MDEIWENRGKLAYDAMIARHKPFWLFMRDFINEFGIKRLVDVGGGIGFPSVFVNKNDYLLIDYNKRMVKRAKMQRRKAIFGEFVKTDTSKYTGKYDLILMAAVVEHCDGYVEMIKKAIEMKPKFIVVSFFMGLKRKTDRVCRRFSYGGEEYRVIQYSRNVLKENLKSMGLEGKYDIFKIRKHPEKFPFRLPRSTIRDTVLAIDLTDDKDFSEKIRRIL